MSLQFTELRLYNAAATSYVLLPEFTDVAFDVKYNDLGAITFGYAVAKAADIGLTDNALIGVVGTDGVQDPKEFERYLVFSTKQDKIVDGTPIRTFEGKATLNYLDDATVYPSNWDPVTKTGTQPPGHEFVDSKVGTVWRSLILRAKARGCFPSLVETTFDGLAGSDNLAWALTTSQNYGTGENYMQILLDQMGRGLVDAWMDGWNLRMQNGGTRGTHIAQGTLELRAAKNVTDISISTDTTESASTVFIAGDDGVAIERHSAPAQTALGRRRERSISQTGISDLGTLTILGDAELATAGRIPTEETIGVSAVLTPFFDFNIADWVWVRFDGDQDAVERRIWQIAVGVDENRVTTVGITANSILYEDDIKTKRKIDAYTGSSGTYGSVGSGADTSVPNAPSGLSAASGVYLTAQGGYATAVLLNWSAPTTNVGGGTITDLDHFEYGWKYSTESTYSDLETAATPGRISPVLPGTLINLRVRAVDTSGNKSTYATINHTTTTDTTPPPTPSTPVVSSTQYGINVKYDGLTSTAAAMPADFDYVEIWHSASAISFVPGSAGSTLAGTMRVGTRTISGEAFGIPTYIRLVAVDKAGNKSLLASTGATSTRGGSGTGSPPTSSPTPTLTAFGVNSLEWAVVAGGSSNPGSARYRVYLDVVPSVAIDNDHLVADSPSTRGIITQYLGDSLIRPDLGASMPPPIYYAKVLQYDADGASPTASAASNGASPRRAGTHELSADAGFFGEVQAEKIRGKYFNGRFVVGDEVATEEVGRDRTGFNTTGFFSEQYAEIVGTATFYPLSTTTTDLTVGPEGLMLTDFPYAALIDKGTASEERVGVISVQPNGSGGAFLQIERSSTAFAHAAGASVIFLQPGRSVDIPNTGDPTFRGQLEAKRALFRDGFETRGGAVGATSSSMRMNASLPSPATGPTVSQFQLDNPIPTLKGTKPSGVTATMLSFSSPVWDVAGARWIIAGMFPAAAGSALYRAFYWTSTGGWASAPFFTTLNSFSVRGLAIVGTRVVAYVVSSDAASIVANSLSALDVLYTHSNLVLSQNNISRSGMGGDGVGLWFQKVAPTAGTHDGVTSLAVEQTYLYYMDVSFGTDSINAVISKRVRGIAMYDGGGLSTIVAQPQADAGKAWADYGGWIDSMVLTSNVITVECSKTHSFYSGQPITIQGATGTGSTVFNGNFTVQTVLSRTSFTIAKTNANIAKQTYAAGAVQAGAQARSWLIMAADLKGSFGYGIPYWAVRIPAGALVNLELESAWYGYRSGIGLIPNASAPWDAYFWTLMDDGSRLYRQAHNKFGDTWKIGFTWSDDNVSGLRHESGLSPMVEFGSFPRNETRLEAPELPVPFDYPNTPPTTDDPNGVRFYMRNKNAPAAPNYTWRLGSGNGHVGVAYGTRAVLTFDNQFPESQPAPTYSVDAGLTAAPASNSFASSTLLTPFRLYSDGGGFSVRGDGTGGWPLMNEFRTLGPITSGKMAAASGFSLNDFTMYRMGKFINWECTVTRTGGAVTSVSSGNITNTTCATVTDPLWRPAANAPASTLASGKMFMGYINTGGSVVLSATAPGYGIANGETLGVGGQFIAADWDTSNFVV